MPNWLALAIQFALALPWVTASVVLCLIAGGGALIWRKAEKKGRDSNNREHAERQEEKDVRSLRNARNELAMLARTPGKPVPSDLRTRVVRLLGEGEGLTLFDNLEAQATSLRNKEKECKPDGEGEYLGDCREWTTTLAHLVTKCDEKLPDGSQSLEREISLLHDKGAFQERYQNLCAKNLVPTLRMKISDLEDEKRLLEVRLRVRGERVATMRERLARERVRRRRAEQGEEEEEEDKKEET